MRQKTKIKAIRLSEKEAHYLDVLNKVYSINTSQFIRLAIMEKIKRDIPLIRKKHTLKEHYPF